MQDFLRAATYMLLLTKGVLSADDDYNVLHKDGAYEFGYNNPDSFHHAQANRNNVVRGQFGGRNPGTGAIDTTDYTAGPRGFRPRGKNIHRKYDLNQNGPRAVGSRDDPYFDPSEDPSYSFTVRTRTYNRDEVANRVGDVNGRYSFIDDVGERHNVEYIAGKNTGFHVKTPFPDSNPSAYGPLYFNGRGKPIPRGRTSIQRGLDGSYKFISAGPDQRRTETSDSAGNVRGSYTYLDDKGVQHSVHYIAGPEIGYRVLKNVKGPHLPTVFPFNRPEIVPPDFYDYDKNSGDVFDTAASGHVKPTDLGSNRKTTPKPPKEGDSFESNKDYEPKQPTGVFTGPNRPFGSSTTSGPSSTPRPFPGSRPSSRPFPGSRPSGLSPNYDDDGSPDDFGDLFGDFNPSSTSRPFSSSRPFGDSFDDGSYKPSTSRPFGEGDGSYRPSTSRPAPSGGFDDGSYKPSARPGYGDDDDGSYKPDLDGVGGGDVFGSGGYGAGGFQKGNQDDGFQNGDNQNDGNQNNDFPNNGNSNNGFKGFLGEKSEGESKFSGFQDGYDDDYKTASSEPVGVTTEIFRGRKVPNLKSPPSATRKSNLSLIQKSNLSLLQKSNLSLLKNETSPSDLLDIPSSGLQEEVFKPTFDLFKSFEEPIPTKSAKLNETNSKSPEGNFETEELNPKDKSSKTPPSTFDLFRPEASSPKPKGPRRGSPTTTSGSRVSGGSPAPTGGGTVTTRRPHFGFGRRSNLSDIDSDEMFGSSGSTTSRRPPTTTSGGGPSIFRPKPSQRPQTTRRPRPGRPTYDDFDLGSNDLNDDFGLFGSTTAKPSAKPGGIHIGIIHAEDEQGRPIPRPRPGSPGRFPTRRPPVRRPSRPRPGSSRPPSGSSSFGSSGSSGSFGSSGPSGSFAPTGSPASSGSSGPFGSPGSSGSSGSFGSPGSSGSFGSSGSPGRPGRPGFSTHSAEGPSSSEEDNFSADYEGGTLVTNFGNRTFSVPPGVSVRAHVQAIDLIPLRAKVPSPSEQFKTDVSREDSKSSSSETQTNTVVSTASTTSTTGTEGTSTFSTIAPTNSTKLVEGTTEK